MGRKINICDMTHEEVIAYAERCKQQNRDRQNKYYQNTVKNDPVKYKRFLEKCAKNNSRYYYNKVEQTQEESFDMLVEQAREEAFDNYEKSQSDY